MTSFSNSFYNKPDVIYPHGLLRGILSNLKTDVELPFGHLLTQRLSAGAPQITLERPAIRGPPMGSTVYCCCHRPSRADCLALAPLIRALPSSVAGKVTSADAHLSCLVSGSW